MRIIGGVAKGRRFAAPTGINTRPTTDRVKESLFAILAPQLPGATVLDLFSGTGNLAFEAISRGATWAHCNEWDRRCTEILKKNADELGLIKQIRVTKYDYKDCLRMLSKEQKRFDLILIDPPYQADLYIDVLDKIAVNQLLKSDGCIVAEHDKGLRWDENAIQALRLRLADSRRYGTVGLSFFRWNE